MLRIFKNKKTKGFTLIEMMVAVSIFVIVAFIVVSALLTMSYAYKKAQKMRLIMDNFNFALQSMSLNLREGVNYQIPSSCVTDGRCISFTPVDAYLSGGSDVCYSLETSASGRYIKRCELISGVSCPCSGQGSKFTSPDINVEKLKFIINDGGLPIASRNKLKILIGGKIGAGTKVESSFFIQNTISQRSKNN